MPIPTELLATIMECLTPDGAPASTASAAGVWARMFARFDPLLGPMSTQLLFARTLALNEAAFPWLPQAATPEQQRQAYTLFASALDGRQADELLAVNRALLESFTSQLGELIGVRLASQFLASAFAPDDAT